MSPVNCDLNDWVNEGWTAVFNKYGNGWEGTGVVALGDVVSFIPSNPDDLIEIAIRFFYQATVEFNMDFNWTLPADSGFGEWEWSSSTIEGGADGDIGPIPLGGGGTETVTLPASTLGFVLISLIDFGGDSPEDQISLSISAP